MWFDGGVDEALNSAACCCCCVHVYYSWRPQLRNAYVRSSLEFSFVGYKLKRMSFSFLYEVSYFFVQPYPAELIKSAISFSLLAYNTSNGYTLIVDL